MMETGIVRAGNKAPATSDSAKSNQPSNSNSGREGVTPIDPSRAIVVRESIVAEANPTKGPNAITLRERVVIDARSEHASASQPRGSLALQALALVGGGGASRAIVPYEPTGARPGLLHSLGTSLSAALTRAVGTIRPPTTPGSPGQVPDDPGESKHGRFSLQSLLKYTALAVNLAAIGAGLAAVAAGTPLLPLIIGFAVVSSTNVLLKGGAEFVAKREIDNRIKNAQLATTPEEAYVALVKVARSFSKFGITPPYKPSELKPGGVPEKFDDLLKRHNFADFDVCRLQIPLPGGGRFIPGRMPDTNVTQSLGRAVFGLLATLESHSEVKLDASGKPIINPRTGLPDRTFDKHYVVTDNNGQPVLDQSTGKPQMAVKNFKDTQGYQNFLRELGGISHYGRVFGDPGITLGEAVVRKDFWFTPPFFVGGGKG